MIVRSPQLRVSSLAPVGVGDLPVDASTLKWVAFAIGAWFLWSQFKRAR